MDPMTAGSLIGAGGGLLGSWYQNRESEWAANRTMNFQRDMSNTAHQREVEDLRKAGLNPILSALGNGATTPSGATPEVGSMSEGISSGINTAIGARMAGTELKKADAQVGQIEAGTQQSLATKRNTDQSTKNLEETSKLISAQSASTALDVQQKKQTNEIISKTANAQIKKLIAEGKYAEAQQVMSLINAGASSAGQLIPNPMKFIDKILPTKGKP